MRKSIFVALFFATVLIPAGEVTAHSTVAPHQVSTSKYETFSLSVPTEKDVPTIGVRLLIPEALGKITPFVKAGWRIDVKKTGDQVTEIAWTGGVIPPGQKDVFEFTAATPKEETTLVWKAYQTYQGGVVVAWDREPNASDESGKAANPYSVSYVVADRSMKNEHGSGGIPLRDYVLEVSIAALLFSVGALGATFWRRK